MNAEYSQEGDAAFALLEDTTQTPPGLVNLDVTVYLRSSVL